MCFVGKGNIGRTLRYQGNSHTTKQTGKQMKDRTQKAMEKAELDSRQKNHLKPKRIIFLNEIPDNLDFDDEIALIEDEPWFYAPDGCF